MHRIALSLLFLVVANLLIGDALAADPSENACATQASRGVHSGL